MQHSVLAIRSLRSALVRQTSHFRKPHAILIKTLSTSQRDAVIFNDGREGWMIEKKGGWYSISVLDVDGKEKVCSYFSCFLSFFSFILCPSQLVKARKTDFKVTSAAEKVLILI